MKISILCVLLCIGGADARIRGARPSTEKQPLEEVVQRPRKLKTLRELKTLDGFGGTPDASLYPLGGNKEWFYHRFVTKRLTSREAHYLLFIFK